MFRLICAIGKKQVFLYLGSYSLLNVFQIEHKSLTLGEVLDGDRMAVSMYEINFKGEYL